MLKDAATETAAQPTNAQLKQWDREIVWHAFTQMAEYQPFIIDHAQGCTITCIDGRELIDGVSSLWCNLHGHRHPKLDQALRDQIDQVAHVTALGMSNRPAIELAKRLTEVSPAGLNHVYYSDNGSTAVEVAVKMAFQYWQQRENPKTRKTRYVALDGAYHGDTLGSVSVGGVERFHKMFQPLLFDVIRLPAPDAYRLPPGVAADEACSHYLSQLEEVLQSQHEEISGVVVESLIQGAAGMIRHPEGFLRGVRELTYKYDVKLILDEVAVGFGRTGKMFACEHEDVSPDFLCLAKGITGGYLPLAATLTTTEVWDAFLGTYAESKTFFHGHTYAGNPLGAAVGLASLNIFAEENTLAEVQRKAERLREHLARLESHPHVGDIRQLGLIAAVELVRDRDTQEPFDWSERRGQAVCDHALSEGVWLRPLGNVVVIMPPLAISDEQLDRIGVAVENGVKKTCG